MYIEEPVKILRKKEVCMIMGWSPTTLWRKVKDGLFPKPVDLGGPTIGWRQDEIVRYQNNLQRVDWSLDA